MANEASKIGVDRQKCELGLAGSWESEKSAKTLTLDSTFVCFFAVFPLLRFGFLFFPLCNAYMQSPRTYAPHRSHVVALPGAQYWWSLVLPPLISNGRAQASEATPPPHFVPFVFLLCTPPTRQDHEPCTPVHPSPSHPHRPRVRRGWCGGRLAAWRGMAGTPFRREGILAFAVRAGRKQNHHHPQTKPPPPPKPQPAAHPVPTTTRTRTSRRTLGGWPRRAPPLFLCLPHLP